MSQSPSSAFFSKARLLQVSDSDGFFEGERELLRCKLRPRIVGPIVFVSEKLLGGPSLRVLWLFGAWYDANKGVATSDILRKLAICAVIIFGAVYVT